MRGFGLVHGVIGHFDSSIGLKSTSYGMECFIHNERLKNLG